MGFDGSSRGSPHRDEVTLQPTPPNTGRPTADALGRLDPPLAPGERVSLRYRAAGAAHEVLGFVTAMTPTRIEVVDRHGVRRDLARDDVDAVRRVPVARGRRPTATPRAELDALAAASGASGHPWVARISDVVAGTPPPAEVPAWGSSARFGGAAAVHAGEWVTLPQAPLGEVVAACWWATRMGARSVQVLGPTPEPPEAFARVGFVRL